jgi:hypothetical protein
MECLDTFGKVWRFFIDVPVEMENPTVHAGRVMIVGWGNINQ